MQVLKSTTASRPAPLRAPLRPLLGAVPLALLALAGCQNDPDEKAPQCPVVLTRPDADHVSHYNGRGRDLPNLVLSVKLEDVPGACKGQIGHSILKDRARVVLLVSRGPAAESREADVQYNVAVTKDGRILEEKPYVQHIVFPPNVDTLRVTGQDIDFSFPTKRGLTGPGYKIYVVLQLTPEELAANQQKLK